MNYKASMYTLIFSCILFSSISAYRLGQQDETAYNDNDLLDRAIRKPGWGKREYASDTQKMCTQDFDSLVKIREDLMKKLNAVESVLRACILASDNDVQ